MNAGKIWMNGKMVPFKDARVHVLTHALHYSTSIFEGIRCYDTPEGPAIFRLTDHVDRLFRSAKLCYMKMQYSERQVSEAIIHTVKSNRLRECYIRPLAYYGHGTMGLTPTPNKVDLTISCWEWKMGESKAGKFSGAKCKISSWLRVDSRAQPTMAKSASNYGNAAMARMEALRDGYDEAIMLNYYGKVTEGSAENIFIVNDGKVMTPPVTAGILEGITRDSVMQIIRAGGGSVIEADLDRADLYNADEVFMTGTAAEVKSVTQVDGIKIGGGRVGTVTKSLQRAFMDAATGKDERFPAWLTRI